jgi:hypothetical protein
VSCLTGYAVVAYQTEIIQEITEFEEAMLIHLDAHEYLGMN